MPLKFEELRVLQTAEEIADSVWKQVVRWDEFTRDIVGKQLAKAADSVGANIAEAFGRYHYGEKLQFLYYARGSLFETKYWLNRASARGLIPSSQVEEYASKLTELARQLNSFAGMVKEQRRGGQKRTKEMREFSADYVVDALDDTPETLFTDPELVWLETTLDV